MDVGHIKGFGGLDRPGDRPGKVDANKKQDAASQAREARGDTASISDDTRETLAAVEAVAERAKDEDASRQAFVDAARARLERGELDQPVVHREIAKRLLDQGF